MSWPWRDQWNAARLAEGRALQAGEEKGDSAEARVRQAVADCGEMW